MMKILLPSLLLPLLCSSPLFAAPIVAVDWGGTELTSTTQDLSLTGVSSSGDFRTWYSTSTSLTSSVSSYVGQPIYGILQNQTGGGAINFSTAALYHNAGGDYISVRGTAYNSESPVDRSISGLLYVKKEDFLNDLSGSAPLRFATGGSLSVEVRQLIAGGTRYGRMAILNDGIWYLSQSSVGGVSTFTVTDPLSVNWAVWNPSGTPLALAPTSFSISGATFENIEAFGIYFYNSQGAASNRQPIFEVSGMHASFEAIPEPASIFCFVLGSGLLSITAFRNRRNTLA